MKQQPSQLKRNTDVSKFKNLENLTANFKADFSKIVLEILQNASFMKKNSLYNYKLENVADVFGKYQH